MLSSKLDCQDVERQRGLPFEEDHIGLPDMVELYKAMDRILACAAKCVGREGTPDTENYPLEVQYDIMEMATNTKATTFRDLHFKMLLWYWDAPDVDDASHRNRADAVLLSVMEDLEQLASRV